MLNCQTLRARVDCTTVGGCIMIIGLVLVILGSLLNLILLRDTALGVIVFGFVLLPATLVYQRFHPRTTIIVIVAPAPAFPV